MQFRAGFTMIEILVTMTIVVILIGLLVVAAGAARQSALSSTTGARLRALSQASSRFESDMGFLPPLLDNDRAGIDGVEPTRKMRNGYPVYLDVMQRRYSYTSPAEYLLGYGDEDQDGKDGLGLHQPGDDGFWNASYNDGVHADEGLHLGRYELRERRPVQHGQKGKAYGPYLELDDPDMLGAIGWDGDAWDGSIDPSTNQPVIYFPGDPRFDADAPKVIVDGWGTPIRYYRVNHPPGQPAQQYPSDYKPAADWAFAPTLADHFALRPWEFPESEGTVRWFKANGQNWGDFSGLALNPQGDRGDPVVTRDLMNPKKRFAFLSAGPNRRVYDWARQDFPGQALNGLSDARGDHAALDASAGQWYEDNMSVRWIGSPAFDGGVTATEEANRDNIVELGE